MAREAIMEINCSRYSEKIIDVINLFNESGWKYYNSDKQIEYLPLGDNDNFDWQYDFLSEKELQELVNDKQNNSERVGPNLYYEGSVEGLTLLAEDTREIMIGLNINRRTVEQNNESLTDIGWYFDNIIQKLKERKCPIEYIKFEEYKG